jgi:hypothetical protein
VWLVCRKSHVKPEVKSVDGLVAVVQRVRCRLGSEERRLLSAHVGKVHQTPVRHHGFGSSRGLGGIEDRGRFNRDLGRDLIVTSRRVRG